LPNVCAGNAIYFDHEEAGAYVGVSYATPVPLPYLANLQVARAGNGYWGFYGDDGIHWRLMGHHAAGFWPGRIGLAAYNSSGTAGDVDAAFDWFRLTADYLRVYLPLGLKGY
jgi:hypothetical protein